MSLFSHRSKLSICGYGTEPDYWCRRYRAKIAIQPVRLVGGITYGIDVDMDSRTALSRQRPLMTVSTSEWENRWHGNRLGLNRAFSSFHQRILPGSSDIFQFSCQFLFGQMTYETKRIYWASFFRQSERSGSTRNRRKHADASFGNGGFCGPRHSYRRFQL